MCHFKQIAHSVDQTDFEGKISPLMDVIDYIAATGLCTFNKRNHLVQVLKMNDFALWKRTSSEYRITLNGMFSY